MACNLSRELSRRGHDVFLVAASRGYDDPPAEYSCVRTVLRKSQTAIPGAGFSGIIAPRLVAWALRNFTDSDVVHVHLARDLVTLPLAAIALLKGAHLVVQTHGMVDRSSKRSAAILDAAVTRRVVGKAQAVLYLSEAELRDLKEVFGPDPNYIEFPNAVPMGKLPDSTEKRADSPREIVFVGRLAPRKRPLLFVDAARLCLARGLDAVFTLIGPDEGEGDKVERELAQDDAEGRIRWGGPLDPERVSEYFARADLLVNTTDNDVFPMAVLESLAAAVPVVIGESSALSSIIDAYGAGASSTETPEGFAHAIARIAGDRAELDAASERAATLALDRFSLPTLVDTLEAVYADRAF